jgi:hypothetical protein
MEIRAYTLNENTNFAPHIADHLLSLANCMPGIRASSRVERGDWIAGVTPARMGPPLRLAYLMQVTEVLSRKNYSAQFKRGLKQYKPGTRLDSIYKKLILSKDVGACNKNEPPRECNGIHGWKQYVNPWHQMNRYHYDTDADRILLSANYFNFSEGYDYLNKAPSGLILPLQYRLLLAKGRKGVGMRDPGWFIEVPDDFEEWVTEEMFNDVHAKLKGKSKHQKDPCFEISRPVFVVKPSERVRLNAVV